jgi:chromosome segregation ATPase
MNANSDTNKLLETISLLEDALNKEMNSKVLLQSEIKDLLEKKIPNLTNSLKLQEELNDKMLISLVSKEKEQQSTPILHKSYFREDPQLKSQLEFYKNKYSTLKDEISIIKENHDKEKEKLQEKLNIEIEKNQTLLRSIEDKDVTINNLYSTIEKITTQNNYLLEEITVLNNYINDVLFSKENLEFEVDYLKTELSNMKSSYTLKSNQIKENDENFNKLSVILNEYKSTLIDMEVNNYIFQVSRIGVVVDTKADVSSYY